MSSLVIYQRELADIFIPPVDILDDKEATDQLLDIHREQKLLFKTLIDGNGSIEDVVDALEDWMGIDEVDSYCDRIEREVTDFIHATRL